MQITLTAEDFRIALDADEDHISNSEFEVHKAAVTRSITAKLPSSVTLEDIISERDQDIVLDVFWKVMLRVLPNPEGNQSTSVQGTTVVFPSGGSMDTGKSPYTLRWDEAQALKDLSVARAASAARRRNLIVSLEAPRGLL